MKGFYMFAAALGMMALASVAQGFGVAPSLESGQTYRAEITLPADLSQFQASAQALGWWVRIQQGLGVEYFQGEQRCNDCDPLLESQFLDLPQLVLDQGLAMIRLDNPSFRLNVRPTAESGSAYEAVVVMIQTLEADAVIQQIQDELSGLALVLDGLTFEPVPLATKATTAVPDGVRLDETLFRFLQAPDWPDAASLQGLSLSGLRARVVVELVEGQTLPSGFDLQVEQRADTALRVQVLIPDLIALAQDPAVAQVRPPLQAQPGRG